MSNRLLFCGCLLMAGCSSTQPSGNLILGDDSDCTPLVMHTGQELTLTLPSDPTSGYRWTILQRSDNLKQLGPEVFRERRQDQGGIGSAGQSLWRFRAQSAGSAQLELQARQPWDAEAEAQARFDCRIEIR
ncbi:MULTISPECIES: protease inhibitor I42 family protein [Pseudomonas]|uniref:Protease inhibitor I42 family protein n=1 Tax=Pseudomonas benzopyrenica TaxID=2993566 RepID=A0ABZ2FP57_9PSED|nr:MULTISPECIES: protease inhibitor I42 family protein [Pseudomonas]MXS21894.1 inhibitor of cysteine peptidase [Pseudomonas oryzihabitans]UUW71839.1 protease inhibitor I42 family protein [Pseudomonas psychrotolerans]